MASFGIMQSLSSWYGMAIMGVIGLLSIYMVALALRRSWFFRAMRTDSGKLLSDLGQALSSNDQEMLTKLKGQRATDPPARILVSTVLSNPGLDEKDLEEVLDITRTRQRERLEKGLSAFGTLAAVSPLLGLLGTVIGIIEAFANLAASGAAGPNVVASGVAAALWTTAAGLIVAIPSYAFYNYFNKKARSGVTDMEIISRELILLLRPHRPGTGKK